MIFANTLFAETSEVNKFLFYENPQPIDSLEVSDINDNNTDILNEDFLKMNLSKTFNGEAFGVIGNFPYNISSQIVFKALEYRQKIPFFCGMFQKEVAQRICEKPGTKAYGILSVLCQTYYNAQYHFNVPPVVFSPPPKVDSGVLSLKRKEDLIINFDEKFLFKSV